MFSRFRSKISKPKNGNKIAVEPSSKLNRKTERQNTTNTVTVGNKKMVSLSDMKPCVKTASPEIENARVLRRSDTFLVDEDYPVGYTAGKTGTIKGYDTPNYKTFTRNKVDKIKTDVFETFYSKRPSKSSRSSKSSSDSYFANYKERPDDSSNRNDSQQQYNSNTYRKPSKTTSDPPAKGTKPSTKPQQKYVYGGQRHCSPERSYNTKNANDYEHENDRFKTITLNSARRSFKNSYLSQTNADKAQYQPSWFVDVDPSASQQSNDRQHYATQNNYDDNNERPRKSSLRRKETFKVERKPSIVGSNASDDASPTTTTKTALNRKHTFRIDDREPSPLSHHIYLPDYNSSVSRQSRHNFEPIRVEIQSSVSERTGKTIPVGVTAPYRRRPDTTDSSINRCHSPPAQATNMKINSSYSALNDIKQNLAQLGRRPRYRSPSPDRSTNTTAPEAHADRRKTNVLAPVRPICDHKFITRCQVNRPPSSVRERETNVVRPRGRSTVACSPRLRTAERSVSRDSRYIPNPTRQFDVRVVTTAGSMAYTSMRDKPLIRILKQPATKPTDWTYNQVYL